MMPSEERFDVLKDKTILLTGGTGSFGNKFVEMALKYYTPKTIRIYSRGEKKQYDMEKKFNSSKLRFLVGDVRDKDRLFRAMHKADLVIHAAALKQVPTCEYNPIEAIRTNIKGTMNIIDAAIDAKVSKVISISTDKAVHPVNLYGATKMTAEKLLVQGNSYTGSGPPAFSCVRYGNVIGSRGSVIPLFLEQKKAGILTITDKRMTRFWISLENGVNFVIDCIGRMAGGEIFVPKIPSMKISDLADAIAPDAMKRFIGCRPGEKLHEVLLTEDEARHSREYDTYFVIDPERPYWDRRMLDNIVSLPDGFRYTSENNTAWMDKSHIKNLVEKPNIVAIVQARMGSSRLPGKILKKIGDNYVLDYVINRLKMCKNLDKVVIATTNKKKDISIVDYALQNDIEFFRGSEDDVLWRYWKTANVFSADIIVRITSDCPLIDPKIVDDAIDLHIKTCSDYTANSVVRVHPKGLDVEVINFNVLDETVMNSRKKYDREHVTPYIYTHPKKFKITHMKANGPIHRPDVRITLDTQEDFEIISKILQHFGSMNFSSEDVIKYYDEIKQEG